MSTVETSTSRPVDPRVVLSALWIAMVLVFAYVDIFGFYRADVLEAALGGDVATTPFEVNQVFLAATLGLILVPVLMIVASLLLPPGANRIANISAAVLYAITVAGSCIGEQWAYYLIGSAVEVILLATIIRIAWRLPKRPEH